MKRQGTVLLGMLLSVLVLGTSVDANAQGRGRSKGFGFCKGHPMGAMQSLDLSDQQRQAMKQLWEEHRKLISQFEADLDVKRAQMQQLLSAEQLDRQAIEAKHAEMEPIRQELRNARYKHRLDMLEILTPEQRKQWLQQKANHHRGRGYHRGWGKQGAPGQGFFDE